MATKRDSKYYVCATDKFLSGWGHAAGKTHKLIVVCNDRKQALNVQRNMKKDRTLSYVNLNVRKPVYDKKRYSVSVKKANDCPLWNRE